jgi:hypothetical protein
MLRSIVTEFVYDSSLSYEEHSKKALASLKDDLRNMIRQKRDAKMNEQIGHKNVELKLKSNEEGRRKVRERIEAELKRQEVDSVPLPATGAPNLPPGFDQSNPRARKSAEFFNPASQQDLSEDETPVQPKSLLSSFAHFEAGPHKRSFDLTPSSRKHVHWKEDKKRREQGGVALVGRQPKASHISKHYGHSKRGLAAISVPKKSAGDKKQPNAMLDKAVAMLDEKQNIATDKKQDMAIPDCGSDSDDGKPVVARNSSNLWTFDDSKGRGRASSEGTLVEKPVMSSCGRLPDSESQIISVVRKSSDVERKSQSQIVSCHKRELSLSQKGERCRGKSTVAVESKANKPSTREGTAAKKPLSNRDTCLSALIIERRQPPSALPAKESNDKSSGRKYPSFGAAKMIAKKASSSRSVTTEASPTSLHDRSSRNCPPQKKTSAASETFHNSGCSKRGQAPRKRKNPIPISSTQTSGLSSSEGIHKVRRRKKTHGILSNSMNPSDDSYAFAF